MIVSHSSTSAKQTYISNMHEAEIFRLFKREANGHVSKLSDNK